MNSDMALPISFDDEEIRPEFASAAVVYLPDECDLAAREVEAWARHASHCNGFGAPEVVDGRFATVDDSLVEILYRVAANLVR
jgi:hypothetical protein